MYERAAWRIGVDCRAHLTVGHCDDGLGHCVEDAFTFVLADIVNQAEDQETLDRAHCLEIKSQDRGQPPKRECHNQ